ncbi:MAG: branched-chain amino acid ABC transporter permease [Paracoccaceae bacterium]|nr:MAG: branched-chain amino acid ABC transporter permease [Paracoccaceae bacterium]
MSKPLPHVSGCMRLSYGDEFRLFETRISRLAAFGFAVVLAMLPFVASPFVLDLATQVLLASIGALALMLLTGFAGQVSLGHAGLLAAGAFTTGILFREFALPFWVTVPAAGLVGGLLGLVFGLPSLRLRGLYLAVSTLALHFVVVYLGAEYETRRGFSTGILIDPPRLFGHEIYAPREWYFILLAAALAALWISFNLLRSRSGRAWRAIRANETVAAALGIRVARHKLYAFVISSAMTAVAGALFALYRGFVSIEAFSLYLSIQYVAMIIIGGMGSLAGALLGALFVTLFPYGIEATMAALPGAGRLAGDVFAVNQAAFGVVMILFLVFEPEGLMGIWRRVRDWFVLWPFRARLPGRG